jgi:hypothetical protein
MSSNHYSDQFYNSITEHSMYAASKILPIIEQHFSPKRVIDFGCGRGAWLSYWKNREIDVKGLDGDYIDQSKLLISPKDFEPVNFESLVPEVRDFDLAMCLEVVEHLTTDTSLKLLDAICAAAPVVLFSAAVPGQGGTGHINERPPAFWVEKFAKRGFVFVDVVRPKVFKNKKIQPWYRYNTLVFVSDHSRFRTLIDNSDKSQSLVVTDYSSFLWKMRCCAIRLLPESSVTLLATAKHRLRSFLLTLYR